MSIPARYSGLCIECGERWQPGDLIRSVVVGPQSTYPEPTPNPYRTEGDPR